MNALLLWYHCIERSERTRPDPQPHKKCPAFATPCRHGPKLVLCVCIVYNNKWLVHLYTEEMRTSFLASTLVTENSSCEMKVSRDPRIIITLVLPKNLASSPQRQTSSSYCGTCCRSGIAELMPHLACLAGQSEGQNPQPPVLTQSLRPPLKAAQVLWCRGNQSFRLLVVALCFLHSLQQQLRTYLPYLGLLDWRLNQPNIHPRTQTTSTQTTFDKQPHALPADHYSQHRYIHALDPA